MRQRIKILPVLLMNLLMESRAKVEPGSGMHSVHTHFPKDPQLRYLLEDENNEGFLQKMYWHSRAQSGKYRDAVVVQDLATQWLQSYPCKTKTSQETQKSLMKFLEPTRKPKVIYTDKSLEFGKACEDLSWVNATQITNKWDYRTSSAQGERRYVCSIVAIWFG